MRPLPFILVVSLGLGLLSACASYTSENWPDLGKGFERRGEPPAPAGESAAEDAADAAVPSPPPPDEQALPGGADGLRERLQSTRERARDSLRALQDSLARLEEDASLSRERLSAELYLSRLEASLAALRAIAAAARDNGYGDVRAAAEAEISDLAGVVQSARRRLPGPG